MSKRIAMVLNDEATVQFERLLEEANKGFEGGRITASDLLSEMVICAKVDIKALQLKHTDLRRSLLALAKRQEVDLDSVMKMLAEMKARSGKKRAGSSLEESV